MRELAALFLSFAVLSKGQGALSAAVLPSSGKVNHPVVWRLEAYSREPLRVGQELYVEVHAEVAAGWHLYALDEPEDGPVPLEFTAQPGGPLALVSVAADRSLHGVAAGFAAPVNFYVGRPGFRLRLRAAAAGSGGARPAVIEARFQACNARVCLPPRVATISFPVTVADARP